MGAAGLHLHVHLGGIAFTDNNVHISLGAVVHEVQVVAAFCFFQIDIYHFGQGFSSAIVEASHLAVEGQERLAFLLVLIEAELIGGAHCGCVHRSALRDHIGILISGNVGICNKLYNILGIGAVFQVAGPGSGDGLIGVVSTQEVLACGRQVYNINAHIAQVGPVAGGIGCDLNLAAGLTLIVQVFFDLDIVLSLAGQVEDPQTLTADALNINFDSIAALVAGLQSAAGNLTVEVQDLFNRLLVQGHCVSNIFLQRTVVYITGTLFPAIQVTTGAELQLAFVVLDFTADGDGIGLTDLIGAFALQAVALDLLAVDHHSNGNVAVACIVTLIHTVNSAGQSCTVGQLFTGLQLCSVGQDLCSIGGGAFCHTAAADAVDHLAACIELDGALIVLDDTGDGDHVIDSDLVNAGALQTVAEHGVLGVAVHNNHNRDVAIAGIIGGVDLGNLTGQSYRVRQSGVFLQSVSSLQDIAGIGGSLNGLALFNGFQNTAGIELDGAAVVLDGTGDSDDVAHCQIGNAVALQAVALDRLIFLAFHHHGNGDVVVLSTVNGVDGDQLAGQGCFVGQSLAICQLVSSINDSTHIDCLGQDHIPVVGHAIAFGIGDGSSQGIGGILFRIGQNLDGGGAITVVHYMQHIFAQAGGPNHVIGHASHTNQVQAAETAGSGSRLFCGGIHCLQVIQSSSNALQVTGRCFHGSAGLGGCLLYRFAACEQAQQKGQKHHPC